jgi:CYTH domain-containing protein
MTFPNKSGDHADSDQILTAELEAAGIEVYSSELLRRSSGEVKTSIRGILYGWIFQRSWYYWVAEGPGIDIETAEALHAAHGNTVRVDGHGMSPAPGEVYQGLACGHYHVDDATGLKALADTIKSLVHKYQRRKLELMSEGGRFGVLNEHPERMVTVHLRDGVGTLAVCSTRTQQEKAITFELPITAEEAEYLLAMCISTPGAGTDAPAKAVTPSTVGSTISGSMGDEIERKFLVLNQDFLAQSETQAELIQGYLNSDPARTVRVRIENGVGSLTVKGLSDEEGLSRPEFEKTIDQKDVRALLLVCEPGVINKTRHCVPCGPHVYQVDVFAEENAPLVLAEIELGTKGEAFQKPDWLGQEVTGDKRYYNSALVKRPFSTWR